MMKEQVDKSKTLSSKSKNQTTKKSYTKRRSTSRSRLRRNSFFERDSSSTSSLEDYSKEYETKKFRNIKGPAAANGNFAQAYRSGVKGKKENPEKDPHYKSHNDLKPKYQDLQIQKKEIKTQPHQSLKHETLKKEILDDWIDEDSNNRTRSPSPFRFIRQNSSICTPDLDIPNPVPPNCLTSLRCNIDEAQTDENIIDCWPVVKVLRPHLTQDEFVGLVKKQFHEGYHLLCVRDDLVVKSILGYKIVNRLSSRKTLQIEDFCTLPSDQGKGYGSYLLTAIIEYAKDQFCYSVTVNTDYVMDSAQRTLMNRQFHLNGHQFMLDL